MRLPRLRLASFSFFCLSLSSGLASRSPAWMGAPFFRHVSLLPPGASVQRSLSGAQKASRWWRGWRRRWVGGVDPGKSGHRGLRQALPRDLPGPEQGREAADAAPSRAGAPARRSPALTSHRRRSCCCCFCFQCRDWSHPLECA